MVSSPAAPSFLDATALDGLLSRMGSPDEFHGMLREFLDDSAALLADLNAAAAAGAGRLHDLERSAHTMKSMAHVVGAHTLEAACREVELEARHHHEVPPQAVADLSQRVHEAQGAVERFLD